MVDAQNAYIPDPQGASGVYARPGFSLQNSAAQLGSGGNRQGQGVHTHIALDGTTYVFCVAGGKIYRADSALATFTDVTPGTITLSATASRVFMVSFADKLIVSDGVNRPWVGTTLSASPIIGTNIDYDGAAVTWCAQHVAVYGGALFFVLKTVNSVARQSDLSWSEPNDPATGYQQSGYDNNWTLAQTSSLPLTGLAATNTSLYYFREFSIGAITGAVGPNLASTATHDRVDAKIGTLSPATIQQFSDHVFFCDAIGRPYSFTPGTPPEPLWLQMRAEVDAATTGYPGVTALKACATVYAPLNLYLAAIWSPDPVSSSPPRQCYAFDTQTGVYVGRWSIAAGTSCEALGVALDANGRAALVVIGSKVTAPATGGYVWLLTTLSSTAQDIACEDGATILTTEGGVDLTTEAQPPVWTDNGTTPTITATTQRLGYASDVVWNVDQCTAITGSPAPVSLSVQTPNTVSTTEGTATPATSQDGMYRVVSGFDVQGRGVQVTVQPTTATSQWALERVQVVAVPSRAGPEEP